MREDRALADSEVAVHRLWAAGDREAERGPTRRALHTPQLNGKGAFIPWLCSRSKEEGNCGVRGASQAAALDASPGENEAFRISAATRVTTTLSRQQASFASDRESY